MFLHLFFSLFFNAKNAKYKVKIFSERYRISYIFHQMWVSVSRGFTPTLAMVDIVIFGTGSAMFTVVSLMYHAVWNVHSLAERLRPCLPQRICGFRWIISFDLMKFRSYLFGSDENKSYSFLIWWKLELIFWYQMKWWYKQQGIIGLTHTLCVIDYM